MMPTDKSTTTAEKPSRFRVAFRVLMLFLLLVLTPAVSWYYLSKGLDYRQDHLQQLERFGPAPQGSWVSTDGVAISSEDWREQLSLVCFLTETSDRTSVSPVLSRIHSQFDDRKDVVIYQFVNTPDGSPEASEPDSLPWRILRSSLSEWEDLRGRWSDILGKNVADQIVLVDRKGELRQTFQLNDDAEMKRLVETVAVMLPPKKVERPQLNREQEK
jgi:hypothetical protein